MSDPFPRSITEGRWETIRAGHELVFMGGERLLEWRPDTGEYRVWEYNSNLSPGGDPLPRTVAEGRWSTIGRGHELVYLFHDKLLDWEPSTGKFRVWQFNRDGGGDPFPTTTCEGQWSSIRGDHQFVYLDGDLVLDWQPASGDYKVWQVDRDNRSDPFPGSAVVSGNWSTIRSGHELVYLSNNRMLDWVPQSGGFKVWNVDRSGRGGDLLPGSAVMGGEWRSIRGQRKLIRVNEKQVLEWEPASGAYRVWQVEV